MNGKNKAYNSAVIKLFYNNDYPNFDTYFKTIVQYFKDNAVINENKLYSGMKDRLPNQKQNLVKQFFNND